MYRSLKKLNKIVNKYADYNNKKANLTGMRMVEYHHNTNQFGA